MTRDHFLILIIGLLCGFIGGYLAHEAMETRQPPAAWLVRAAQQAGTSGAVSRQASTTTPGAAAAPSGAPAASGTAASGQGADPSARAMAAMEEVQRLRAHVAENPDDAPAVRQLADLNYDIRNWTRAAELYEQYLELQPGDAEAMTDLGATYRNLRRPDEALTIFREAQARRPDHWQARYNEVLILAFDLQQVDEAKAALEALREMQPDNPEVARLSEAVARL